MTTKAKEFAKIAKSYENDRPAQVFDTSGGKIFLSVNDNGDLSLSIPGDDYNISIDEKTALLMTGFIRRNFLEQDLPDVRASNEKE